MTQVWKNYFTPQRELLTLSAAQIAEEVFARDVAREHPPGWRLDDLKKLNAVYLPQTLGGYLAITRRESNAICEEYTKLVERAEQA